jgi:chromate transporter
MTHLSLGRLTAVFLRVCNTTFGGGDPTMAALYTELVTARRWMGPEIYGILFALARITPGTNMLAFCAGAAWHLAGWPAAILAVAATAVPSAAIIVLLTVGYQTLRVNPVAMAAIGGTVAAAVGMMLAGTWQLLRPHLVRGRWLRTLAIAAGAFALAQRADPIQVLAAAAAVGFFWQDRA